MIEVNDNEIQVNGSKITFPVDNAGRPSAMLVGLDDNETIRPVRVDNAGQLRVDTSVTVNGLELGSVGLTGLDAVGALGPINRIQNPGSPVLSSLMVQDVRLNFLGTELQTLAYGRNGSTDYPIATDASGKLNVNVVSAAATTAVPTDAMYSSAPAPTTDVKTSRLTMNCQHMINKTVVIANTGAAAANVWITASVDGGLSYPIPLATQYEVVAGSTYVYTHNTAVTNIQIQVQNFTAATPTTVGVTAYAMGA